VADWITFVLVGPERRIGRGSVVESAPESSAFGARLLWDSPNCFRIDDFEPARPHGLEGNPGIGGLASL
jgi:hypothetical protein